MQLSIKKLAVSGIGGLVLLVGAGAAYIFYVKLGYLEIAPNRTIETPAVSANVEVIRDKFGVPHIYGDTTEDVFFASGYTMAEDRLFQVEVTVRAGQGRLSELFGASLIKADKYARQMGYTDAELKGMINDMPDEGRAAFLSMVAGVNHYIGEALGNPDEKLPIEFDQLGIELKKYEPTEILTGITMILRIFGAAGGHELNNQAFLAAMTERYGPKEANVIFNDILPLFDPDAYVTAPDHIQAHDFAAKIPHEATAVAMSEKGLQELADYKKRARKYAEALSSIGITQGASRTVVISSERSATGNPLMMQATADGFDMHLIGPDFDFAGLGLRPFGMPIMGRGKNVGILITTGERDTKDTFIVKLHPEDKYKYLYKDVWRDMDVRQEVIKVNDGKPVTYEVAHTIHGPVVSWDEDNKTAYSLRWAMWKQEANIWASALNSMKIKSADEFAKFLPQIASSSTNISYADAKGHIGFRHMGDLPLRPVGHDPRLPLNGDGSEDWLGFAPADQAPTLRDPSKGYIFIWNNSPAPGTTYGDGSRWGKHFRTHLPVSLIEGKEKISIDDLKAFNRKIGAAFYSVDLNLTSPKFFEPYFREAIAATEDTQLQQAARLMMGWNGLFEDKDEDGLYDDAGLTLFRAWLPTALEVVFNDDIDDWWRKLDEDLYIPYQTSLLIRAFDGKTAGAPLKHDYFNGVSRPEMMLKTIQATIDKLKEDHHAADLAQWRQPVFWRYMSVVDAYTGDKNRIRPGRSTSYSGAAVTFRYLPEVVPDNGMPDWTAIMEIGKETPWYLSSIPSGGQSWFINTDWKANPHIADQYNLHNKFDYKKVSLDRDTILQNQESRLVFMPSTRQ